MKSSEFKQNDCQQVQSYLDSYVNDELLVETNHDMQKHLEGCPNCAAELEERQRIRSLLQRAVLMEVAPAALRTRIQEQIRTSQPVDMFSRAIQMFSMTRERMAIAASLALVLCLAAWGAVSMWNGERNLAATLKPDLNPTLSEQALRILSIGLGDHVHCAIDNSFNAKYLGYRIRDLEAVYAGLAPMVKERIGKDFEVTTAHHCWVKEREFIHLTLQNRKTMISLVATKRHGEVFPLDDRFASLEPSGAPLFRGRTEDYRVVGFEAGEHLAFVASNLDTEENARLALNIAPSVRDFLMQTKAVARF